MKHITDDPERMKAAQDRVDAVSEEVFRFALAAINDIAIQMALIHRALQDKS